MIITEPKGVAIVTGARRAIGREIAISLTAAKYQVAALARSEIDLFETIRLTEKVGPRAVPFLAEVTNEEQVSRTVSEIEEAMGPVNLLVNNAGVAGGREGLDSITPESFMRMLEVHMGGTFICTQAALPLMSAGSSIVNLSSIAGLAGWGPVHYASAKGAILGFTRASSRELGGSGIRINAVAPGVVETPMIEDLDEALLAPLIMMSPLGRIGQAEEIASTILYLACGDSSFVTGQWISPNGGLITI